MSAERLERVEERIAWLERHVMAQDRAMLELAEENRRLRVELQGLRTRLGSATPGGVPDGADLSAGDERPPHY